MSTNIDEGFIVLSEKQIRYTTFQNTRFYRLSDVNALSKQTKFNMYESIRKATPLSSVIPQHYNQQTKVPLYGNALAVMIALSKGGDSAQELLGCIGEHYLRSLDNTTFLSMQSVSTPNPQLLATRNHTKEDVSIIVRLKKGTQRKPLKSWTSLKRQTRHKKAIQFGSFIQQILPVVYREHFPGIMEEYLSRDPKGVKMVTNVAKRLVGKKKICAALHTRYLSTLGQLYVKHRTKISNMKHKILRKGYHFNGILKHHNTLQNFKSKYLKRWVRETVGLKVNIVAQATTLSLTRALRLVLSKEDQLGLLQDGQEVEVKIGADSSTLRFVLAVALETTSQSIQQAQHMIPLLIYPKKKLGEKVETIKALAPIAEIQQLVQDSQIEINRKTVKLKFIHSDDLYALWLTLEIHIAAKKKETKQKHNCDHHLRCPFCNGSVKKAEAGAPRMGTDIFGIPIKRVCICAMHGKNAILRNTTYATLAAFPILLHKIQT
jgi:hypothetical protein